MLLVLLLLSLAPAAAPTHDLLFMGPSDTREPWGLQYPLATPVQPLPSVPPPVWMHSRVRFLHAGVWVGPYGSGTAAAVLFGLPPRCGKRCCSS